jgi:hypothetical protein
MARMPILPTIFLLARGTAAATARATSSFRAALAARGAAMGVGVSQVAGRVSLRATGHAIAQGAAAGKSLMLFSARSTAAAAGRIGAGAYPLALSVVGLAAATGRAVFIALGLHPIIKTTNLQAEDATTTTLKALQAEDATLKASTNPTDNLKGNV